MDGRLAESLLLSDDDDDDKKFGKAVPDNYCTLHHFFSYSANDVFAEGHTFTKCSKSEFRKR